MEALCLAIALLSIQSAEPTQDNAEAGALRPIMLFAARAAEGELEVAWVDLTVPGLRWPEALMSLATGEPSKTEWTFHSQTSAESLFDRVEMHLMSSRGVEMGGGPRLSSEEGKLKRGEATAIKKSVVAHRVEVAYPGDLQWQRKHEQQGLCLLYTSPSPRDS